MITKVAFQRLRRMSVLSLLVAIQATMLFSCRADAQQNIKRINMEKGNLKEIYLAGGCFWGTEHYFKQIDGVENVEVILGEGIAKVSGTAPAEAIIAAVEAAGYKCRVADN